MSERSVDPDLSGLNADSGADNGANRVRVEVAAAQFCSYRRGRLKRMTVTFALVGPSVGSVVM
jgi:hypothetical protein